MPDFATWSFIRLLMIPSYTLPISLACAILPLWSHMSGSYGFTFFPGLGHVFSPMDLFNRGPQYLFFLSFFTSIIYVFRTGFHLRPYSCFLQVSRWRGYRQTSSIRHTKSQRLNVSHLVLQLSLPNPVKPSVENERCRWTSADRRCPNYISVVNNFIA